MTESATPPDLPTAALSDLPDLALLADMARQITPAGALYVVATPIGNVGDISVRALHILQIADAIACEDTRNTGHLLARYGIAKPLLAAHEHNEREVAQTLITRLQAGERIALVSDAGTPAVSDPGARIVDAVRQAGVRVIPLPGACAGLAALAASGLVNDQFHFVGFLPAKAKQREASLNALLHTAATIVLYEAPHRILDTVAAIATVFEPNRQIVIARELTKLFEEIHRCPMSEALAWISAHPNRQRGEFVLLIEGAQSEQDSDVVEAERVLKILLAECPLKQAAGLAAQLTGQKKNALYEMALALKAAGEV